MMRLPYIVILTLLVLTNGFTQEVSVSVSNPSSVPRENEPVVIAWNQMTTALPTLTPQSVQLLDESNRSIQFQIDDMNQDGVPDEFVFMIDLQPREVKHYTVKQIQSAPPTPQGIYRTDAQNWKRINGVLQSVDDDNLTGNSRDRHAYRFDGVGWESDSIAYRVYLDERNAVDLLGKRKPGLYWNWIGKSKVDYQLDAAWGMDILHVGEALGVGGIGFWVGDSIVKPLAVGRERCRIVARGPLRAVVRVEYQNWNIGIDSIDCVSTFIIYRGDRFCEHRVEMTKGNGPHLLGAGIVKKDSTGVHWNPSAGTLYTTGRQSRANDSLMMGLVIEPSALVKNTEDAYNHLLVVQLDNRKPVRIFISSTWQGETNRMWTDREIQNHLNRISHRLVEPLKVRVLPPSSIIKE